MLPPLPDVNSRLGAIDGGAVLAGSFVGCELSRPGEVDERQQSVQEASAKETHMTVTTEKPVGADIRPFRVNVPEAELIDMRRRIAATRWPEKETVADTSQGVPLRPLQDLARYWATDYDWRKCETKLNALPQFTTEIDGLDIHFIHVRSRHETRCRSSSPTGGPARSSSS